MGVGVGGLGYTHGLWSIMLDLNIRLLTDIGIETH